MVQEIKKELTEHIIPFWKNLRDNEYGGYYGFLGYDLTPDKGADKGCILNNRITWFFSSAYTLLKEPSLLDEARHGYEFLRDYCMDRVNGGVFWSMTYDGKPSDTTKHTYNQAFCIYALSSYYEASGDKEALKLAYELFDLIEEKCTDELGYMEAFNERFEPADNDKLSENGVMAEKTMNTLLHVFEAYTELYRVVKEKGDSPDGQACGRAEGMAEKQDAVKKKLMWIMDVFADHMYNAALHRQEVFFDREYHTLIDLHSYGHDIETAWLIDRGVEVIDEPVYKEKMTPITKDLTENIYKTAFNGHSLANECERGVVNTQRIWWVQAETVVGFINGYQKEPSRTEYLDAAKAEWEFIKKYQIDHRKGSEWFYIVSKEGVPDENKPIVEAWKCPYHNGRMCMEVIKRLSAGV